MSLASKFRQLDKYLKSKDYSMVVLTLLDLKQEVFSGDFSAYYPQALFGEEEDCTSSLHMGFMSENQSYFFMVWKEFRKGEEVIYADIVFTVE